MSVKLNIIFLVVLLGCAHLVKAGVVLSFFEGRGRIYATLQRSELINLWYSDPVDYGMDCSLYSTGQYGVIIFFRGDVVAEAFVSTCNAYDVAKSFSVPSYSQHQHHILVHFRDKDSFYTVRDSYDSTKKNCVEKFFHQRKYGELYTDCINGWCNFDDLTGDYTTVCIQ